MNLVKKIVSQQEEKIVETGGKKYKVRAMQVVVSGIEVIEVGSNIGTIYTEGKWYRYWIEKYRGLT